MKLEDFISAASFELHQEVTWQAPSNIALIKYWGKYGEQLPKNPSLSFTLNQCVTTTTIDCQPNSSGRLSFSFEFEGQAAPEFHPKIDQFFQRIIPFQPWLKQHHLNIKSSNSFPHSSGIASSASAMAALSIGLMDLERQGGAAISESYFYQKASFLARLGSGSAARSVQGPLCVWGETPSIPESSDLFAHPISTSVHPSFQDYQDAVLLIDKGTKVVSSSQGHALMEGHPFAERRFEQAHQQLALLKRAIETGAVEQFIRVVESEALTLHAMMMTSQPYFILMHPNTLAVIHKVWEYRKANTSALCFTLDAGANVHLLYPKSEKEKVNDFIARELSVFCQSGQYILDEVGSGVKKV
ncbi:diphosphomevalonate decarboxylase [Flavobacteriaceae bacterium]|nr:diphosphomevalonate decarboxylase [Flavobacteriaceae bacterium]